MAICMLHIVYYLIRDIIINLTIFNYFYKLKYHYKIINYAQFFKPLVPIGIHLLMDSSGRASGEADVEFSTHDDAVKAMTKDKGHMEHRYIELFLNSSPGGNGSYSGSGKKFSSHY